MFSVDVLPDRTYWTYSSSLPLEHSGFSALLSGHPSRCRRAARAGCSVSPQDMRIVTSCVLRDLTNLACSSSLLWTIIVSSLQFSDRLSRFLLAARAIFFDSSQDLRIVSSCVLIENNVNQFGEVVDRCRMTFFD